MRFLITMTDVGGAFDALPEADQHRIQQEHAALEKALVAEGRLVAHGRCAPAEQARTVHRDAEGRFEITVGPHAGIGGEAVGGFYVIEAADLEEAVAWAKRARFMPGANEVRPLED